MFFFFCPEKTSCGPDLANPGSRGTMMPHPTLPGFYDNLRGGTWKEIGRMFYDLKGC